MTHRDVHSTKLSVCVDPDGGAAVFLQRPDAGLAGLDIVALARSMAACGLRLRGVSSSEHGAPANRPAGAFRSVIGDESLLDAVQSLVDLRDDVLA